MSLIEGIAVYPKLVEAVHYIRVVTAGFKLNLAFPYI